ncbi:MAG: hypothetical protein ABSG10_11465 [Terracidiphilus sp.]
MISSAIFQCPNCNETITSSAESCHFCGAKVDREAANREAERLAKINQACRDASSMRSAALMLPVLFALRFVPFIRLVGGIGFLLLLLGIPLWAMIWWHKYGGIVPEDPDVVRARRTVKTIAIIVPMVLAFFLIVEILMAFVALR